MSGRRAFVRTVAAGLLVVPLSAAGVPPKAVRRVGWLHLGQPWNLHQFRDKMKDLGWIEGRNLVIDARFADNDAALLPALAAELVDLGVDVIVTQSTPAAVAAKSATTVIPIVMAGSADPVGLGLIGSLARPGGNVTGVTHNPGEGFSGKIVQLLKEIAPQVTGLVALDRSGAGGSVWDHMEAAARSQGITLLTARADTHAEVPQALAAALRQRGDGLYVPANPVNEARRTWIADFARTHRLPAIAGAKDFVASGMLMSHYADWGAIRRQAAVYVDKILEGADPGELPVERPSRFELAINVSTARALGLTIPRALMLRADELYA